MDIQEGKSGRVFISDQPWIPGCRLIANKDGSLILEKVDSGPDGRFTLLMGPPPWVFVGRKLRPVSPAASQWNWNAPHHNIPRGQVGKFLNQQWKDLEATGQVESQVDPGQFEIVKGQPEFHLQLEGGLARLQARLRCRYGVSFHTLNSRSDESKSGMGDWIADESHPFRYWTRDGAQEKQAVDFLIRAGFTRIAEDGLMEMRSQEVVLPFFASHFQELKRKKWIIELDARLESSLDTKLEYIEPSFQFTSSGEDWFEMNLQFASAEVGAFSEADIHDILRSGKSWRKKPDGKFLMINAPLVEEFTEVLRDCSPTRHGQNYRFHSRQAPFLSETIRETSDWRSGGNLPDDWQSKPWEVPLPQDIQTILRDYQRHGVNWMMNLSRRMLGGILADDMGLGKTLQTLTMIRMLRPASGEPRMPTMVICPTSLVFNWEAEAAKFAPDLKVLALHGPKRESLFPQIIHHDLVITSFALIQRDIDHYLEHNFESVLVDEAQNIKNPKSRSAQAIRRLRSRNRFALTGTPIENRILDLWSVMDFVMPGYLGDMKDFQVRYEAPIAKLKDASVAERLRRRVKPFILRRLKSEVAKELPEKIDQVRLCEMSQDQASLYRSILNSSRDKIANAVQSSGFARNQFLIFQTLTRLRQVCCDVRLLGADDRLQKTVTAKLELFQEILDEALEGGHKVLVFSQFTSMLALLEELLREKEVGYALLQGSTRQRQKVIDGFRHDDQKKVFLISLKAGGTGLNLTEADVVIHYDPWWNPAIEDQATSRAHRIGQRSVVTSYKLITKGTIEEKIVHLQQKKKGLIPIQWSTNPQFQPIIYRGMTFKTCWMTATCKLFPTESSP
ncbi:MAG: SNF2 family helicase [Verrucomicrobia bacterium]|nr:SNF2 family helicase [Verrucomicrobiota bacterium]